MAHPKTLLLGDLQNTMTDTSLDNWGDTEAATPHSILRVALDMGMVSTFRSLHPAVHCARVAVYLILQPHLYLVYLGDGRRARLA